MTDLERLQSESDEMLFEINDIKHQIAQAKADVIVNGVYSDPVWFAKANAALKHKQRQHQQILIELGKANREIKRNYQKRLERAFVDIAREHLDGDLFQFLWHKALDEAEHQEAA